jgi:hypothetical protein
VTLSSANGSGSIYYTTDGSNPTDSGTDILYSGPFTVSQSETINAACNTSGAWSPVASACFTINGTIISPVTTGSNSAEIAQLEQELDSAISSGQMTQATQILQQLQQLEAQNASQTQLSSLQQRLIAAVNNRKWRQTANIMKQIAKIEASETSPVSNNWVYSLLGQANQQQGINNISVFNNGNQINFDVQPVIIGGRTMIPIRQLANAFGIPASGIVWNPNGTVNINNGSSQIQLYSNEQQASLNGTPYSLDVPAQIVNNRMLVPLRAIGDIFHKNVQWYPNGRIVTIQ